MAPIPSATPIPPVMPRAADDAPPAETLRALDELLGWIASRAKRPRLAGEQVPPAEATIESLFHIMDQADNVMRAARQCVRGLVSDPDRHESKREQF